MNRFKVLTDLLVTLLFITSLLLCLRALDASATRCEYEDSDNCTWIHPRTGVEYTQSDFFAGCLATTSQDWLWRYSSNCNNY